jgi:type IV pilus assembly protein PilO
MANMSDIPKGLLVLGLIVIAVLLSAGMYFVVYKSIADQNSRDQAALDARKAEVNDLRRYENNLPELNRQIEALKQQLEIQKHIVPDEQAADQFMHLMQNTARESGIEVRKYVAGKINAKEYFAELPFDMELDGPYYSVMNFFDRVSKLERIINVSNVQLNSVTGKGGKYQLAPDETVTGSCTSTTFFSREPQAQPAAAPAKKKK